MDFHIFLRSDQQYLRLSRCLGWMESGKSDSKVNSLGKKWHERVDDNQV